MSNIDGKVLIFSAPSGAGKTTVVKHLLSIREDLDFSISACTRNKRPNEIDGKDYYFLSVNEFKEKIEKKEFIEYEEVYADSFYGTLKKEIERIWEAKHSVIFDVDVQGGINLKKYFGEKALSVFIKAPSFEILEERLRSRNTETEESIQKRLNKAKTELEFINNFDKIIINDDLKNTLQEIEKMTQAFL